MTPALWSDEFNEVLAQSGLPIGFDSVEAAERTAVLYPTARLRVIEVAGAYFPASEDLLAGRLILGHRPDGS